MSKSQSNLRSRLVRAGIAGTVATAVVVAAASPANAAVAMTLSAASGPSAGTNTLTAVTTTAAFTMTTPGVEFQYVGTGAAAACSATYAAPAAVAVSTANPPVQTAGILAVPAGNVKKLSTSKLAITVPASVALATNSATPPVTQTTAKYNVCVYTGTTTGTSTLVSNAAYTIAAAPTVTAVNPVSGPSLGGQTITVTGTNFPTTGLTASLGGTALTGISVASDGTYFTATTPAHSAGTNFSLTVNTPGGTVNKTNYYAFQNGISASPNFAPATATAVDVDVTGTGFLGYDFTAGATKSKVYLVDGAYNPADSSGNKTNGPVAECTGVLVVSDGELICTLNLAAGALDAAGAVQSPTAAVAEGTYTLTVVSNGGVDVQPAGTNADANYQKSIVSSGSTFTVAPF
ncbi:IPT/TIG domain-containing protein [Actinoplanes sp. TFC3]|uniref:IPT/TIG domain-containing protein n=1 Tax=Actinoplanes sp. TFC3 TaxID=1710355 RepID=UPI00082E2A0E|nr:IPT/TIG domain-containing protein [Actinoplanes sp. TFC3]